MAQISSRCPRSASAYENICLLTCDEDDVQPSSSERLDDAAAADDATSGLHVEVMLERDKQEPNGLGFRIVGSRSSGIFIAYVHPSSPQANYLREGDRLLACESCSLLAVSVDQAACILRYYMQRQGRLKARLERRRYGEWQMTHRRRLERRAMRDECDQRNTLPTRATLRISSSKSAEVFRDGEFDYSHSDCNSSQRATTPTHYFSIDTHSVCPHCNSRTRLLYLHQFSHGLFNSAFRLLTLSRSTYSLL